MNASASRLAKALNIPKARGLEAVIKARLISAVLREAERRGLTHAQLAELSALPRSAVTGILSGSLQKVTIDGVLRLVEASGLLGGGQGSPRSVGPRRGRRVLAWRFAYPALRTLGTAVPDVVAGQGLRTSRGPDGTL